MNDEQRTCVTSTDWGKMSLEEKVEVLGKWSVLITEWAEGVYRRQTKLEGLIDAIHDSLKAYEAKANGGGIPPKHPKDPHC